MAGRSHLSTSVLRIERYEFRDDGLVPNNPTLPLIVYRDAYKTVLNERETIAALAANGWSNGWINGIYDFHHYHATAHEVLVIARGEARVLFGGPSGRPLDVTAGDAVLIPAGVGHCRLSASRELSVVGAYPGGADWDLVRAAPPLVAPSRELIAAVPLPALDPITGAAFASGRH